MIGSQPATWKILTFKPAGGSPALQTRDFAGEAFRVLGFSQSGDVLYGWNTQGESDWWMTPLQVVIPDGKPEPITTFTKKTEPVAISNGTTAVTQVAPSDGSTTEVAGVDPQTYQVLDTGDLSGHLNGWEVRDVSDGAGKKLEGLSMDMALAWAGDGSIVVADVTHTDRAATITTVLPEAPGKPLTPTFSVPAGGYWRLFEGCRNGYALLGLGAPHSGDASWQGADELVLIELSSARSSSPRPEVARPDRPPPRRLDHRPLGTRRPGPTSRAARRPCTPSARRSSRRSTMPSAASLSRATSASIASGTT